MKSTPHIICIGAASQDVFLSGKALTSKRDVRDKTSVEQFPLGAKVDIDKVYYSSGGGATNAAVTFARQGLSVSFMGKVGHDPAGAEVLRNLRREGVATDLALYDTKVGTSYSTILVAPTGERVVLVYRGASHDLKAKEFAIAELEADWLYITSVAGNFDLLTRLIKHAKQNDIKVALAPGKAELSNPKKLRALLSGVEVLLGNREELQQLFESPDVRDLLLTSIGMAQYIVVTDAAQGVYVSDSDKIFKAPQYKKVKVVDRTGAGDAFGSGFIASLAQGGSLADAITLGSANATSVVQYYGAKAGILRSEKLKPLPVSAISL